MSYSERALVLDCLGDRMVGIVTIPTKAIRLGVLILVGGPQYRVGSHRQFTLLARGLAKDGICSLRFDYRGMGDSEGESRSFEDVAADVRTAIDGFLSTVTDLTRIVIWGLCDAASTALMYSWRDARIAGLVLLNPWVRTPEGQDRTILRHYYGRRIFDPVLWRKIGSGEFRWRRAGSELISVLGRRFGRPSYTENKEDDPGLPQPALPERMAAGFEKFGHPVLVILSGNDLTADEFRVMVRGSTRWQKLLSSPMVRERTLPEATHTFSSGAWRDFVLRWTSERVQELNVIQAESDSSTGQRLQVR